MVNIAIFASGNGSNAENIIRHFQSNPDVNVAAVFTNKADAYVATRAAALDIPVEYFPNAVWKDGHEIANQLKSDNVQLIVLAGFLAFISEPILHDYPNRIVNIHPSLLPKFGGKGMWGINVHRAVLEAGEKISGITVHYVTPTIDGGDIIAQFTCEVLPTDTPETLQTRVHALEYQHFPKVIEQLIEKL